MARLGSIYRFRNSVLENGVARPSKYEVIITPPENLKNMVTNNSTLNIIEKNIANNPSINVSKEPIALWLLR